MFLLLENVKRPEAEGSATSLELTKDGWSVRAPSPENADDIVVSSRELRGLTIHEREQDGNTVETIRSEEANGGRFGHTPTCVEKVLRPTDER